MKDNFSLIDKLREAIEDPVGLYIPPDQDETKYISSIANDIIDNACAPFMLSATVMPPGFPYAKEGELLSGECVAHNAGYWLVYDDERETFYCFWGTEVKRLGAHGIYGSPLYCWSA